MKCVIFILVFTVVQVGTTENIAVLRVDITAYKLGVIYKWVLQHQQCILVVQVGTTENLSVLLHINIGCFTSGYYSVTLLSDNFRYCQAQFKSSSSQVQVQSN